MKYELRVFDGDGFEPVATIPVDAATQADAIAVRDEVQAGLPAGQRVCLWLVDPEALDPLNASLDAFIDRYGIEVAP